jgi:two-component system sensor histidine kinase KdpD
MQTARGPTGLFGINCDQSGMILTLDGSQLLNALSDQAALAVARVNRVRDVDSGNRRRRPTGSL